MKINIRIVTVLFFPLLIALFLFSLASFTYHRTLNNVWEQLGMTEESGLGNIQNLFLVGYFYDLKPAMAKKIAIGDRAGITMELLRETKKYVHSKEFKDDYELYRKELAPKKPEPAKTKEQIRQELIQQLQETIDQNKIMMEGLNEEQTKAFTTANQKLENQLKEYKDVNSATINLLYDGEVQSHAMKIKKYEEQLKDFNELNPPDVKALIKDRLQLFLELTEGINYDTQLINQRGLMRFADPVYERKPKEWKMAFRCGKEVTETARKFAKQWVADL